MAGDGEAVVTVRVVVVSEQGSLPAEIIRRLDRIERLVTAEGRKIMELDDILADIATQEDSNTADLARLLADFENAPGTLTDAQRTALSALKQHLVDNQASIDAADAPAAGTTGGDAGSGAAGGVVGGDGDGDGSVVAGDASTSDANAVTVNGDGTNSSSTGDAATA